MSAADAVAMAHAGLAYLASADMASLPAAAQAECLRGWSGPSRCTPRRGPGR